YGVETSLVGKRLEEQREAQAGRACLVRQEPQFVRQKCPMLGQFVARPLPLHRQCPSVGTEWTRRVLRTARTSALTSGLRPVTKVPRMTSVGTLQPLLVVPAICFE